MKCTLIYLYLSYFKTFMSLMSELYIYRDLKFDQKKILADAVTYYTLSVEPSDTFAMAGSLFIMSTSNHYPPII